MYERPAPHVSATTGVSWDGYQINDCQTESIGIPSAKHRFDIAGTTAAAEPARRTLEAWLKQFGEFGSLSMQPSMQRGNGEGGGNAGW